MKILVVTNIRISEVYCTQNENKLQRVCYGLSVICFRLKSFLQKSEYQPGSRPTGTASRPKANQTKVCYRLSILDLIVFFRNSNISNR